MYVIPGCGNALKILYYLSLNILFNSNVLKFIKSIILFIIK